MRRLDVQVPAPDGRSNGTLHLPDGDGPWPGVLVFPDAGGARETFRQMGDRLAAMDYAALIPDIYYRAGEWHHLSPCRGGVQLSLDSRGRFWVSLVAAWLLVLGLRSRPG